MKLSEIARYCASKELTSIAKKGTAATLSASFAAPQFTLHVAARDDAVPKPMLGGQPQVLRDQISVSQAARKWKMHGNVREFPALSPAAEHVTSTTNRLRRTLESKEDHVT